jgi:hypothetical protein
MFITAEDFNTPPYRLPNLDESTEFSDFVQQEELDRLRKVLGRTLCDAFLAGLFTLADDVYTAINEDDIEQRWKDLRDGKAYTGQDGKSYYWEGLEKTLKPYIFSAWIKADSEKYNGAGGVGTPLAENMTVGSPAGIIVRAFNQYSLLIGNECRMEDTLYGYLYNSGEDFTDSIGDFTTIAEYLAYNFQDPGKMNVFNL